MTELPQSLVELARRYGVATEYVDWTGAHTTVAETTLIAVLDALGVPSTTEYRRAAALAEAEAHHPAISFGWGYATISLQTKKIKGLHENDFIMAAKTNELSGA